MKKALLALLVGFAMLVGANKVSAAKPISGWVVTKEAYTNGSTYFVGGMTGSGYYDCHGHRLIEQQTGFGYMVDGNSLNPITGLYGSVCAPDGFPGYTVWDIDDWREHREQGTLSVGESHSISIPTIIDNQDHMLLISAGGQQGRSFTITIQEPYTGFTYTRSYSSFSSVCVLGPTEVRLETLPEITGSNGGRGAISNYKVTMTATDKRGLGNDAGISMSVIYPNGQVQHDFCKAPSYTPGDNRVSIPGSPGGWYLIGQ